MGGKGCCFFPDVVNAARIRYNKTSHKEKRKAEVQAQSEFPALGGECINGTQKAENEAKERIPAR